MEKLCTVSSENVPRRRLASWTRKKRPTRGSERGKCIDNRWQCGKCQHAHKFTRSPSGNRYRSERFAGADESAFSAFKHNWKIILSFVFLSQAFSGALLLSRSNRRRKTQKEPTNVFPGHENRWQYSKGKQRRQKIDFEHDLPYGDLRTSHCSSPPSSSRASSKQ